MTFSSPANLPSLAICAVGRTGSPDRRLESSVAVALEHSKALPVGGNVASYSNFALAYDPANRLSSATTGSFVETYAYDASNHRIERVNSALDTVYFFSPSGALLSEFNCLSTCTLIYNRIYFGGMALGTDGTTVNGTTLSALGDSFTWTDRLGSAQSTYPYGADIGSYPAGADAVDFGT